MSDYLKKRIIFYLILGFVWSQSALLCAQKPYVWHLNKDNYLPVNSVFSICQDTQGYLWMATSEGLFQYDGYNFQAFRSNLQSSLAGSQVQQDKFGRIWYQNFDGFYYYVENGTLNALKQNQPVGFMPGGMSEQYLFVFQRYGIDVYDLKTLDLVRSIAILFQEAEHGMCLDNDFYFIADDILYKIDKNLDLSLSNYFENKNLHVKYVYPFRNQLYVVSKNNEEKKLYFFDSKLNFKRNVSIPWMSFIQGSNVYHNHIWLHTPKGSYVLDSLGVLTVNDPLFPENNCSQVLIDKQENYWFSSLNNGIYFVPGLENKIYNIDTAGLYTMLATSNGYLFGTLKGDIVSTDKEFQHRKIVHTNANHIPIYYLYYNEIDNACIISDNGVSILPQWNEHKLRHLDVAVKEVVRLDDSYYAVAASGFMGLMKNPNTKNKKRSIWDSLFAEFKDADLPEIARIKRGLRAKSVEYLPEKNQLFYATNVGTFVRTPKEEFELKYQDQTLYSSKLAVLNNELFILNNNGELFKVNSDLKLKLLNSEWEIPAQEVISMKKSGDYLLILTQSYLFAYQNGVLKYYSLYVEKNKIRDYHFDGTKVYVLTNLKVMSFDVSLQKSNQDYYFYISDWTANAKSVKQMANPILKYNQNNISIKISLIDFLNKNSSLYYRINKNEWIRINRDVKVIDFPSLAPGKYQIEFKLNDHVLAEQVSFEIQHPIWETWWFYLGGLIAIVMAIYLIFKRRSSKMRAQIRLLHEKNVLERNLSKSILSSVKAQMNPHFFYNALNTIQAYIFVNDRKNASMYLSKFSKLTRIILEMSERENISLKEEIYALELYLELEKMRFSDNFEYEIIVNPSIEIDQIEFPPMLLQPYVENAVKHGLLHQTGAKILQIRFLQENDLLWVEIEDNGIGRKRSSELIDLKNKKHQSFSTHANEKRLEILNKGRDHKIAVEIIDKISSNDMPNGTIVKLRIPI